MYTAIVTLLILALLTIGGWFSAWFSTPLKKWAAVAACVLIAGLSLLPVFEEGQVRVHAASVVLLFFVLLTQQTQHPIGAVLAASLGGLVGWKLCDTFPLFVEQGLLIAAPTLLLTLLYGLDAQAKVLAVAAAPFVTLVCFAVSDDLLFRYCVLSLGSTDALVAQTVGLLCLLLAYGLYRSKYFMPIRALAEQRRNERRQRNGKDQTDTACHTRDDLGGDVVVADDGLPIPVVHLNEDQVDQRTARKRKNQRIGHGADGVAPDVHAGTEHLLEADCGIDRF